MENLRHMYMALEEVACPTFPITGPRRVFVVAFAVGGLFSTCAVSLDLSPLLRIVKILELGVGGLEVLVMGR